MSFQGFTPRVIGSEPPTSRQYPLDNPALPRQLTGRIPRSGRARRVDVQRYVTARSSKASPYSVQKELNALKHMLRLAVEWEIIPINPAQGIKTPKVPAGRVRYLQPTELKPLLEASPDWLKPIVALAVSTGMHGPKSWASAGSM